MVVTWCHDTYLTGMPLCNIDNPRSGSGIDSGRETEGKKPLCHSTIDYAQAQEKETEILIKRSVKFAVNEKSIKKTKQIPYFGMN